MNKKRESFSGSIGFVLAAAGSAVGLGNIWRFPFLAARDGGGLFLVVYLVLALTFGFTLLTAEVVIGRNTKSSPLTAYGKLSKRFGWVGAIASIVPFMILPYYCVIGGWVLKYFIVFLAGYGLDTAADGYFGGLITAQYEPIIMLVIFLGICAFIIYKGVASGIEQYSKILMPVLILLVIGISVFAMTLKSTDASGNTVTALQGMKVYLIPSFEGVTFKKFLLIVMDAAGQLFYSLSIAMGIMIAYGSYVPDEANLVQSINRIEIFDTAVAFLAGVMIIPAVFVFMGPDGMAAGPSLMFVSLPKVFAAMGPAGRVVGTLFFAMVLFAAVTSAMSVLEAVVSGLIDHFKLSRTKGTVLESVIALALGILVCLGYNVFYFELPLPNGAVAQILDIMDYISNYVLMPVVAIATCILIGWVMKPEFVFKEAGKNGEELGRKGLFTLMIKFVAPVILSILLLMSLGIL